MAEETLEVFLEGLRKDRDAYAGQFGFDIAAIGRDLRERERLSGRTIVNDLSDRVEPFEGGSSDDKSAPTSVPALDRGS